MGFEKRWLRESWASALAGLPGAGYRCPRQSLGAWLSLRVRLPYAHPERFGRRLHPPVMPTQFWINQPETEPQMN